jgi:acyl transferase domain-containing protein
MAVSLKLVPYGTLGAASAGMLSVDGRCKTLDARANGYARSEGIGALVVTSGEHRLLLSGSAVRQDGRSASLTAPNGSAQRTLLRKVLSRAVLGAFDVGRIEAHGTGTALGDPTEAGALAAVHGDEERTTSVAIGAAKANVGHTEASSGQVGLLRLSEMAGVTSGNAQLRLLNPLVGERLVLGDALFVLPTQLVTVRLASVE